MSKPNQRSIKSFFEGPKRPRTQESTLEDVENKLSKSAKISSHFSDVSWTRLIKGSRIRLG